MSSYYKRPPECFVYDKASDFGKVISTYFLYDNDIENKSPTDLCVELYNIKQELDAIEDERMIREYLKLAKLLRKLGQL
ncbi:MAG: hypothetical protein HG453_001010 [Clostridiales bacterium]|nr:hypothetical protein [Clostridiales bacterium]